MAKNVHHVRKVNSGLVFLNFYFHCRLAHQKGRAYMAGTPLGRPSWLPLPQALRLSMVPLPPMPNLESLNPPVGGHFPFFSRQNPPTLEQLSLEFGMIGQLHVRLEMKPKEIAQWDSIWDLQESQPLPHRQGPLTDLKNLRISFMAEPRMTTSDFMMLFSECPNIETLGVPWAGSQADPVALGLYIGKMCSKLRHVHPSHIRDDYQLSVTITSTMAPNTLQGLSTYDYSLDVPTMSTILERHSSCLRIVKMEGYVHLTSALIRLLGAGRVDAISV
ncbi:hypothetical protein BGX24_001228 [Mortierella sp. AD032]|nr:hypothetical protein BGX24_001228 [Mortierella sp. AD032]